MQIIEVQDKSVIDRAVAVLKSGGLVIYPTETCYGIAADATNEAAITKLLRYKDRQVGKAISIAVTSKEMASQYVELNNEAQNIYDNFLPGPVTVISKSKGNAVRLLESEEGTLGVRISLLPMVTELVNRLGNPITATSANISGAKTPYQVADIVDNISEKKLRLIDLAIDGGLLPKNPPSTVIDTTLEDVTVYRPGNSFGENSIKVTSVNEAHTVSTGESEMLLQMKDLATKCILFELDGSLGAGKTYFTKGVAKALDITQTITSPSYNYVSEYPFVVDGTKGLLLHIDLWRIKAVAELELLNMKSWFRAANVVVIEWASRFHEAIDSAITESDCDVIKVKIEIEYLQNETRKIHIKRPV